MAFVLAAFLLVLPITRLSAHKGTRIYPIYEIPTSDLPNLHDGTLEDWEIAVPAASLVWEDFQSVAHAPSALDDFAVRVFLAWHARSQRLYVGIQTIDDFVVDWFDGADPRGLLHFDSFAFFVDGDHSGGGYTDYPNSGVQAQRYNGIASSPAGTVLTCMDSMGVWVTSPPYAEIGAHQVETSPVATTIELYLTPWDLLIEETGSRATRLSGGRVIGFNLLFYDHDESTEKMEGVYTLEGSYDGEYGGDLFFTADGFVDGELIPCDRGDCSGATATAPSAVVEGTWGRIKASFR